MRGYADARVICRCAGARARYIVCAQYVRKLYTGMRMREVRNHRLFCARFLFSFNRRMASGC